RRRPPRAPAGARAAGVRAGSSRSGSPAAGAPPSAAPSVPSSPAPSPSPPPASSPGGGTSANAKAQIKANWEAFFDGNTSAAKKISLLENGQKFASVINAQAGSGLASSAGAKVTAVVVNSATKATVSYDITLSGATAPPNQTRTAVYPNGTWKVGDVSFCQLLKLENNGTAPGVCSG